MTEIHRALGRWPNAPLALVLAQVRFEPSKETAPSQVVQRLQQIIGSRFPNILPLRQMTLILGQGGSPDIQPNPQIPAGTEASEIGFDMRNPENSEAIRVHQDAFTFMTSAYVDSVHFAEQWKIFMGALFEARELRVTRLGLRYLDFIIPSDGHVPEDYLQNLGKSPEALGEQASVAFNFYNYPRADGGELRLQFFSGKGTPSLPPDLQDTVTPPARLSTQHNNDTSAVLDMDRWRPANEPMKAEAAATEIIALREDIALSFRKVLTELACREWASTSTKG